MFYGKGYQKSDNFRNDLVCNSAHQNKKKSCIEIIFMQK